MTKNPYVAPADLAQPEPPDDGIAIGKRLDTLSHGSLAACILWFGMMIVGRIFDQNAPPLHELLSFYLTVGVTPAVGIYGALSTLKRKRYVMSVLGFVCMSIPCLGPWLGLTIPLGIWALILLRRPDIRASFTSTLELDPQQPAPQLVHCPNCMKDVAVDEDDRCLECKWPVD